MAQAQRPRDALAGGYNITSNDLERAMRMAWLESGSIPGADRLTDFRDVLGSILTRGQMFADGIAGQGYGGLATRTSNPRGPGENTGFDNTAIQRNLSVWNAYEPLASKANHNLSTLPDVPSIAREAAARYFADVQRNPDIVQMHTDYANPTVVRQRQERAGLDYTRHWVYGMEQNPLTTNGKGSPNWHAHGTQPGLTLPGQLNPFFDGGAQDWITRNSNLDGLAGNDAIQQMLGWADDNSRDRFRWTGEEPNDLTPTFDATDRSDPNGLTPTFNANSIRLGYLQDLNRNATSSEVDDWLQRIAGGSSLDDALSQIGHSGEALAYAQQRGLDPNTFMQAGAGTVAEPGGGGLIDRINQLYGDVLHRPGDDSGVSSFADAISRGEMGLGDVGRTLAGSAEGQRVGATAGAGSAADLYDSLSFQNLGRAPTTGETTSWNTFLRGGGDLSDLVRNLQGSEEGQTFRTTTTRVDPDRNIDFAFQNNPMMRRYLGLDGAGDHPLIDAMSFDRAFNGADYYQANPDVAASGVNPLLHYLQHGATEGRALNASGSRMEAGFDPSAYISVHPELGFRGTQEIGASTSDTNSGFNPLDGIHTDIQGTGAQTSGNNSGFNPLDGIDRTIQGTGAQTSGTNSGFNPLDGIDTTVQGRGGETSGIGGDPNRGPTIGINDFGSAFNPSAYFAANPDVARAYNNDPSGALQHFLRMGYGEGRAIDPNGTHLNAGVDTNAYISQHPGIFTDPQGAGAGTSGSPNGFNPLDGLYTGTQGAGAGTSGIGGGPVNAGPTIGAQDFGSRFTAAGYYAANPDVAAAGIDPWQHFLRNGFAEGRAIDPNGTHLQAGFDLNAYAGLHPELFTPTQGPGGQTSGIGGGAINPSPGIDTTNQGAGTGTSGLGGGAVSSGPIIGGNDFASRFTAAGYNAANPDVAAAGINPWLHYLRNGFAEGRAIDPSGTHLNAGFDIGAYSAQHPELFTDPQGIGAQTSGIGGGPVNNGPTINPFGFSGANVSGNPEPADFSDFSSGPSGYAGPFVGADYLQANPDVAAAGINPFWHYMTTGFGEDRALDSAGHRFSEADVSRGIGAGSFDQFGSQMTGYQPQWSAANETTSERGRKHHIFTQLQQALLERYRGINTQNMNVVNQGWGTVNQNTANANAQYEAWNAANQAQQNRTNANNNRFNQTWAESFFN